MHYYPFNIGAYALDTAHLDDAHDLAYRRLIDFYYLSEKPIPLETQQVSRRLRLGFEVVQNVLREFFSEREDGWHQARCDAEIMEYHARAATSRSNGQKGGRRKKPSRNPAGTQQHPDSIPAATSQPPRLVTSSSLIHTLIHESEAPELPAGFPKTVEQAIDMAQQAGCPAPTEYLSEVWEQAAMRGGKDGANVLIVRWGLYAKMRWGKEEMEWTAKRRKTVNGAAPRYDVAAPDDEPELAPWEILQRRQQQEEEANHAG